MTKPEYTTYPGTITVLSVMEGIRKRPAMYVGPLDNPLLANTLLLSTIEKAIEGAAKGTCKKLSITIIEDTEAVVSYDLAWSIEIHEMLSKHEGRPCRYPEMELAQVHAAGTWSSNDKDAFLLCCTNALSNRLAFATVVEGGMWGWVYERGERIKEAWEKAPLSSSNTTSTAFGLDTTILPNAKLDFEALVSHLKPLLPEPFELTITDERTWRVFDR